MQDKRACPNCGADITGDSSPVPDIGGMPHVEECGATLGPLVVEHQCRDYLGQPFGVVGVDDFDIPMTDK